MNRLIASMACMALFAGQARAAELIQIGATKKTADTRTGSTQSLPRGESRATSEDIYYEISLKSMSADVPAEVDVEWVVLVEGIGGNVRPRSTGRRHVTLAFGRAVEMQTESFTLRGRTWSTGPRPGEVAENIAGYGIRVTDASGRALGAKYSPPSVEKDINWDVARLSETPPMPTDKPVRLPLRRIRTTP